MQEACFTDTVVLFRRKVKPEEGGKEGSDGGRRKAQDFEQVGYGACTAERVTDVCASLWGEGLHPSL